MDARTAVMFRHWILRLTTLFIVVDSAFQLCNEYLVSGEKGIRNEKITASSYVTNFYEPWMARFDIEVDASYIYSKGSWRAKTTVDTNEYIQAEFRQQTLIEGIVTKGRENATEWVTKYKVFHSDNGVNWTIVPNPSNNDVFDGNVNNADEKVNNFSSTITARYIRIQPVEHQSYISMRFDVLGCTTDFKPTNCIINGVNYTDYLVDGEGGVSDYQITASSYFSYKYVPWSCRLRYEPESGNNGWATGSGESPYIQVDFEMTVEVACVALRARLNSVQFVRSYFIRHSQDGATWQTFKDLNGNELLLPGVTVYHPDIVITSLPYPVLTRMIRLFPIGYKGHRTTYLDVIGSRNNSAANSGEITDQDCQVDGQPCNNYLVSGQYGVGDDSISASSFYFSYHYEPWNGRLNGTRCWLAASGDSNPYVQVDLKTTCAVSCVVTRGCDGKTSYTKTYKVLYSQDGSSWTTVKENSQDKVFIGNKGLGGTVFNKLPEPVYARYIRITSIYMHIHHALRFDLLGCWNVTREPYKDTTESECIYENTPCNEYLVSGPNGVPNEQITASSFFGTTNRLEPWSARINYTASWASAASSDPTVYINVDFGIPKLVTCIVTKGRYNSQQHVRSYYVKYSIDGTNWTTVKDLYDNDKLFTGNNNENQGRSVIRLLTNPVYARHIRIVPYSYFSHKSLRFDVLGCSNDSEESYKDTTESKCIYENTPCNEYLVSGPNGVPNEQITASSFYGTTSGLEPWSARINYTASWTPAASSDPTVYINVDFGIPKLVTCIVTKGRYNSQQHVRSYYVKYSIDGTNWTTVKDLYGNDKLFTGNNNENQDRSVISLLTNPVYARHITIVPYSYFSHKSLRFDVLGCSNDSEAAPPVWKSCSYGNTDCQTPLVNPVLNSQITSSSDYTGKTASDAKMTSASAWTPMTDDPAPYLQVELNTESMVTCIGTIGNSNGGSSHMRSYRVEYSIDGATWLTVDKLFPANVESTVGSLELQPLPEPLYVKFIRVVPVSYRSRIAFRMEVLGCLNETTTSRTTDIIETTDMTTTITDVTTNQTTTAAAPCVCTCVILGDVNLTIGSPALAAKIEKLADTIRISKNMTTKNVNKKISVQDKRQSSEVMGVLAGSLMTVVLSFFVLVDLINICMKLFP